MITGLNKIYDSNNSANITISGLFNNDTIYLVGYFDSVNVNNNINITISSIIKNSNYYQANLSVTANIQPKLITSTFIVSDKIYDGTTNGSLLSYSLSGLINNDNVILNNNYNVIFDDYNVNNVPVIINNVSISGLTNYIISISGITYANILQTLVTVNLFNISKTYDGTTNAILNYTISGIYNNDFIDICNNYIANYRTIDVNNNITIDISNLSIYGSNNYSLLNFNNNYGTILPAPLIATGLDKVYDVTNIAYLTISGLLFIFL